MVAAGPEETPDVGATYTVHIRPGDHVSIRYFVVVSKNGSVVPLTNTTIAGVVVNLSRNHIVIGLGGSSRIRLPLTDVVLPEELAGAGFSAPVAVVPLGDVACTEFRPIGDRAYIGGPPGRCKPYIVYREYSSDGLLLRETVTVFLPGGALLVVHKSVTAARHQAARPARVDAGGEPLCSGAISDDIRLVPPGVYLFAGPVVYRACPAAEYIKERPLLVLDKTPESQEVWSRLLDGRPGRLYVYVKSPLLVLPGDEYDAPALYTGDGVVTDAEEIMELVGG